MMDFHACCKIVSNIVVEEFLNFLYTVSLWTLLRMAWSFLLIAWKVLRFPAIKCRGDSVLLGNVMQNGGRAEDDGAVYRRSPSL
jgi:hypothetical protein